MFFWGFTASTKQGLHGVRQRALRTRERGLRGQLWRSRLRGLASGKASRMRTRTGLLMSKKWNWIRQSSHIRAIWERQAQREHACRNAGMCAPPNMNNIDVCLSNLANQPPSWLSQQPDPSDPSDPSLPACCHCALVGRALALHGLRH